MLTNDNVKAILIFLEWHMSVEASEKRLRSWDAVRGRNF